MVKVYSITVCPWCEKVKRYLKYRGIAYEEHNIEHDAAALEECRRISGATTARNSTRFSGLRREMCSCGIVN